MKVSLSRSTKDKAFVEKLGAEQTGSWRPTENLHVDPYAAMSDAELFAELERLGIEAVVQ